MEKVDYSVVVPVFNSEPTLKELHKRLQDVFKEINKSFEIIFIDDGSVDGSWDVLKEIKKDNKHITAITLNKNFGQHNATFCGFTFAKGDFIITIDDDLQIPPEEIRKLIHARHEDNAELVYGLYKKKQHSKTRNLGTKYAHKSSRRLLDRSNPETSFRLISKEIIDKIIQHHQYFIYIDELLNWYTDNISLVFVEHKKRQINKSGYNRRKLWGLISNVVIYYTNIPLRIMVYGGFIASFIFLLVSVYYLLLKIFFNVPLGYTSIIVGILLSTSLILFCLGIIGEYLRRIYMVQNKKPPFSIKKILS